MFEEIAAEYASSAALRTRLAQAWIEELNPDDDKAELGLVYPGERAFSILYDMTHAFPEIAWLVILEMLAMNPPPKVVWVLAAGPVEELMVHFGNDFIQRVEQQAERDAKFRELLGGVWANGIEEEVWNRICAARGGNSG